MSVYKYKKYWSNGVVVGIRLSGRERETDPPGEGSLDLKVNGVDNSVLHCFMDNDVASLFYRNKVVLGDTVSVLFVSAGDYTKVSALKEKRKELVWIEKPERFSNYYNVSGEIIAITQHPEMSDSNRVILNCGMNILTRVTKLVPLKVGDYIQMEGRLDAHIIGKVEGQA